FTSKYLFATNLSHAVLSGGTIAPRQAHQASASERVYQRRGSVFSFFNLPFFRRFQPPSDAELDRMLIFADGACFAPLVKLDANTARCGVSVYVEEDGSVIAVGPLVDIDSSMVDMKELGLIGLIDFDSISFGTEVIPSASLFDGFERAACIQSSQQPIGPDSELMNLPSCFDPAFAERMHWYYCGFMNTAGLTQLPQTHPDYRGRRVNAETCEAAGVDSAVPLDWYKRKVADVDDEALQNSKVK
ncbi:MAG: hypothetical protein AAF511_12475, partial [Pseudomonadota bacterium]